MNHSVGIFKAFRIGRYSKHFFCVYNFIYSLNIVWRLFFETNYKIRKISFHTILVSS